MGFKSGLKTLYLALKEEKKIAIAKQVDSSELLQGKIALITGGSGGIGLAIAEAFLKNGAKVIIAGRDEQKLKKCCEKLGNPDRIVYMVFDLNNTKAIQSKINEAVNLFEEKRIDILVNSAGIMNHSGFFEIYEKEYDSIMNTNVKSTFFVCQAMANYMIKNGVKGHILIVSSSSAVRPAWTPYQMSKWAINGFTKGLADMLIKNDIVVNAIGPGPTATTMLGKSSESNIYHSSCPAGRYVLPDEIANLATFMVSDMGNMIIGETYYMTGGSGTLNSHK